MFKESILKYEVAIKTNENFSNAYLNLGAAYLALYHQLGNEKYLDLHRKHKQKVVK